jgi:hypothetical protein
VQSFSCFIFVNSFDDGPQLNGVFAELVRKYEEEVDSFSSSDAAEHDKLKLDNQAVVVDDDFVEFQSRMQRAPAQCFRYSRGASSPLWTHSKDQLTQKAADFWRCSSCHGPVIFEFQIMPQLLSYLDADPGFDFGTIAVYTCRDSCDNDHEMYNDEHCWRQPPAAPM